LHTELGRASHDRYMAVAHFILRAEEKTLGKKRTRGDRANLTRGEKTYTSLELVTKTPDPKKNLPGG